MKRKLHIGIAGCGIGGLAAAALLRQAGHHVTLIERFETPAPVGSGLVVQPVGQQVLASIGVLDHALGLGARIVRMQGQDAGSGRTALDARYDSGGAGRFGLAMHRASLFAVLHEAAVAQGADIVTGAQVTGVSAAPGRVVELADGRRLGPFDLVVDASGAQSALRPAPGRVLRYGAIWGTIDLPDALPLPNDELRQRYMGASRMLGILPIGRLPDDAVPKAAIFWSLPEASHKDWLATPLAQWKAEAASLWPEFGDCLDQITAHEQMVLARYRHGTMRRPVDEAMVHIGDAAHMSSPQLGQGANMALLDAAALAQTLLGDGDITTALQRYAQARARHVWLYQKLSAVLTPLYQSDSHILPVIRDRVLMPLSQIGPVSRIVGRIVCGDIIAPLRGLGEGVTGVHNGVAK